MTHLYVPEHLDLSAILPPELHDGARYFLHQIEKGRVFSKRPVGTYTQLKMAYMQNVIGKHGEAEQVRDALVSAGIVETDRHYKVGVKAMGYRLKNHTRHQRTQVTDPKLERRHAKHSPKYRSKLDLPVHRHLFGWIQRLDIDEDAALASMDTANVDVETYRYCVQMVKDRQSWLSVCDYNRIHTVLTSLPSSLRGFLRYEGSPLVTTDIVNSQPFFFGVVLVNWYRHGGYLGSFHTADYCYSSRPKSKLDGLKAELNRVERIPSSSPLPCVHYDTQNRQVVRDLPPDVTDYISLVTTGSLYERLMTVFPGKTRDDVKTELFAKALYCKNKARSEWLKPMREMFPNVMETAKAIKKADFRHLSYSLMRAESALMIGGVCNQIMEERPDMPLFTIHDSVVTTPENLNYVRQVMANQFSQLGLMPQFKVS